MQLNLKFDVFDDSSPIVHIQQNFDDLLIPKDHVSRHKSDTYYIDDDYLLRTHTSAHQSTLMKESNIFLCSGDVYRRDEIDRSHYPIFHQMEGVRIFDQDFFTQGKTRDAKVSTVAKNLQQTLEGMVNTLFGNAEKRWIEAYFPFTNPSFELEICYNNEWFEVL